MKTRLILGVSSDKVDKTMSSLNETRRLMTNR